MAQSPRTGDLTTGPMLKKIILFSLPLAASSILQLLFNAADVVVVGRFAGSTALAAVGSNGALINLLVNLFVGLSLGANVVAARCFGAKDEQGVQNTVQTSVTLGLVSGVLLAFVGFFAARGLLELMSCPEDVIDLSTIYLKIYFIGMPMTMLYNFNSALLRAVGDTRRPLYCLTASGLVNVVLNLIFVIVFDMSVAGVGLATVISQGMAAFMVVCILVREQGPLHLDMRLLRLSPEPLRLIITVGLPTGVQSIVFNVANVVVQSTINSFGSAAMAGAAAAHSIEGFVYCIMDSFAQTCVTFTSQNLGAGKLDRVDRAALLCNLCAFGFGLVLGVASVFVCLMVASSGILQAYGREKLPVWTLLAGGAVKIAASIALVSRPDIGIHGAPISTLLCYGLIAALNLGAIRRSIPTQVRLGEIFGKPLVMTAVMALTARAVYGLLSRAAGNGVAGLGAIALATRSR